MAAIVDELQKEHGLTNIEDVEENGNTLLHLAIKNEKITQNEMNEVLQILLDKGVDPDVKNKNNETVLQLAVNKRMKDVVEILLARKVNIDSAAHFFIDDEYAKFNELSKQFDELDSEIQKIESESVAFIEFLIAKGVDFSCKHGRYLSALCMAIIQNLQHILPILLKYTNDINIVNERNNTLLHLLLERKSYAIRDNWYPKRYKTDVVKILLDAGILSDAEDNCKRTPIQLAIENEEDIDLVEALLDRSKKVHYHKNSGGETSLHTLTRNWARSSDADTDYYKKIARALIAKGVRVNEPDNSGWTPIFHAVERHNLHVVEFLRDNGANFEVTAKDGRTLMHALVESNIDDNEEERRLVDLLIGHLMNIHRKNSEGRTLLHVVLRYWPDNDTDYHEKIARALIAKGANINEVDKYGETPLCYAIKRHNLHAIEFLRKNGADFGVITKNGDTLMHLFIKCSAGWKFTGNGVKMTLFNLLMENLGNIHHKNSEGKTLLHVIVRSWALSKEDTDYYIKIAQILIAKGANVNEPDNSYKTPLHHAVEMHNLRVVEFLKENGADFGVTTRDRGNLIHLFINSSDCEETYNDETAMSLLDLLLERLTSIDDKNPQGQTVFHTLIEKWIKSKVETDYYMKVGSALIVKGADVNEPDRHGKRPLFHAVENHKLCVVKFLGENGADFGITARNGETLMHLLVKSSDYMKTDDDEAEINLCKLLISKGCQVNARDKTGLTPLHVAAMHSNVHVVRMLIEHGALVNCKNNQMETPLHCATKNSEGADVLELLLKQGANVNAKDSKGHTPLHKMAFKSESENSYNGLSILLKHGADINIRDQGNRSAYIYAFSQNHFDYEKQRKQRIKEKNQSIHDEYYRNYDTRPWHLRSSYEEDWGPVYIPDDYDDDDDDFLQETASSLMTCLVEHSLNLKAANLPWEEQIDQWNGDFYWGCSSYEFRRDNYEESLQEIPKLKSTFIDNHTSLYDFLHLDLNSKCAYLNNETMQQLVHSSDLEKEFPKYEVLILASYHEAVTRKALLERSKKAWLELTKIELPDICIERVFSFLNNSDLFAIIE